jgi:hypothetical protein
MMFKYITYKLTEKTCVILMWFFFGLIIISNNALTFVYMKRENEINFM